MAAVLEVASDIHCPWANVCVQRLRRTRDALGLDVVLRQTRFLKCVGGG
jgi:hypothetical protein